MARQTVCVRIRGQEFRVVSEAGEEVLQRVAGYLDDTLAAVEERTGTVDSLDLALLTGLNLAREIVELRERRPSGVAGGDPDRLRSLIELAESALEAELPALDAAPAALDIEPPTLDLETSR